MTTRRRRNAAPRTCACGLVRLKPKRGGGSNGCVLWLGRSLLLNTLGREKQCCTETGQIVRQFQLSPCHSAIADTKLGQRPKPSLPAAASSLTKPSRIAVHLAAGMPGLPTSSHLKRAPRTVGGQLAIRKPRVDRCIRRAPYACSSLSNRLLSEGLVTSSARFGAKSPPAAGP
jgi:hypothetical protein